MRAMNRRDAIRTLAGVVLAGAAAACTDRDGDSTDGSSPSPRRPVSPFTGEAGRPRPVLAVKIDNVRQARPHTGLGAADLVYAEQVEAGQTRLMAVLSTRLPGLLGPVRSARESDLEILRQFGRPALGYSGAQSKLNPLIEAAPLYALSPGDAPDAFQRDPARPAPYNLYVRPERLLDRAPQASTASDIGFRFGQAPPGGRAASEHTVRFPAARYGFSWDAGRRRWLVSMDGAPARTTDGGRLTAATVVVQRVTVRDSRFRDRSGSVSPYTESVGSGSALVLRDGMAYEARWERPDAESGTRFSTADGQGMLFARGPVWVVYQPR